MIRMIDEFQKRMEEGKDEKDGPALARKGHSLGEILKNKNQSRLFGDQLERNGLQELAQRFVEENLQMDDFKLLEAQRLIFSEKMAKAEKIEKLLTPEMIKGLARNHPDFAMIINQTGPEGVMRAIKSQLLEMSLTNPDRFSAIEEAMETHESYNNGEHKEVNDKVTKFCKERGITPKEYLDALEIEDPEKRRKAFKELAIRKYGGFKQKLNSLSFGAFERSDANTLEESAAEFKSSMEELDALKDEVGDMLFLSIAESQDMRNAITREIAGTNEIAEVKPGFSDAKEAANFNETEFVSDWEAYKTDIHYDTLDERTKNRFKENFVDEKNRAYKQKNKGFWASIFGSGYERQIKKSRSKLK